MSEKFYWTNGGKLGGEGFCHTCIQDGGDVVSEGLVEEMELVEATTDARYESDRISSVDYCCNCDKINALHA